MLAEINGLKVFYERFDAGGVPVLLMHGWGCSHETVRCLFDYFVRKKVSVISLDFPGFGQSDEPPPTFTVYDYADIIEGLLSFNNITEVTAIGHSFGGRVAAVLAARGRLKRVILMSAAGLKPHRGIKYLYRRAAYKLRRLFKMDTRRSGSPDYIVLSQNMKSVFKNVVNEYLDEQVKEIHCPALIIWGKKDRETPPYMAKKLNKYIKDSAVIFLKNCGHYCYLEESARIFSIAYSFIKETL